MGIKFKGEEKMLYYNGKWYDGGKEITIAGQDKLFTTFSNGKKRMNFEVNKQIENYNTYPAEQIAAKIEYSRLYK